MEKFTVSRDFVKFPTGSILELTDKQASKRAQMLEAIDEDIYRVTRPAGFKRGEVVGCDAATMPKGALIALGAVRSTEHDYTPQPPASVDTEAMARATTGNADSVDSESSADEQKPEKSLDEVLDGFTDKEIKKGLDKHKISYGKTAKRKGLQKRLKKAIEKEQKAG